MSRRSDAQIAAFLKGTVDPESPLSSLRGVGLVLREICDEVEEKEFVDALSKAIVSSNDQHMKIPIEYIYCSGYGGAAVVKELPFPEPKDIVVNMMPFKLHRPKATLPEYLHPYLGIICRCPAVRAGVTSSVWDYEAVAYLTVHESFVKKGQTQRRPGVHIDAPLARAVNGGRIAPFPTMVDGRLAEPEDEKYREMAWGMGGGNRDGWPIDGIYVASTVADSTAIWPVRVEHPASVCDAHGSLTRKTRLEGILRDRLGPPLLAKANELHWITDRTPHESLPMAEDTYRQFFRLVVGPVSIWYTEHNTANPLGILPDATVTSENKYGALPRGPAGTAVPDPAAK